jgi:hypothetical protein
VYSVSNTNAFSPYVKPSHGFKEKKLMTDFDLRTLFEALSTVFTALGSYYAWSYRRELRDFIASFKRQNS